jgi:HAMP domain-containing protein
VFAYITLATVLYFDQDTRLKKATNYTMEQHNTDIHLLLDVYFNERITKLEEASKLLHRNVENKGGIVIKENTYTVNAISEQTQASFPVTISAWELGGNSIEKAEKILDSLAQATGCEFAIFQKIPLGMLRIATTLRTNLQERRINAFLPNEWQNVQMINEGKTYKGRLLLGKTWYLVQQAPIKQNGKIIGVLAVLLPERNFAYLEQMITQKKYLKTGHIYFFTPAGEVILHRDKNAKRMDLSKVMPEFLQIANKQKKGDYRYYFNFGKTQEHRRQYFAYYKRADFYTAIAVSEAEFLNQPLLELRNLLLGFFMVFLAIVAIVVYIFSNSFTKPFAEIARALGNLAVGKKTQIVRYKSKDEIGSISNSVNQLIQTSEKYASFAKAIGENNFNQPFEAIGVDDVLGKALIQMRNDLKRTAEEEKIRNWVTVQNAHFSEVIRKNQDDRLQLANYTLGNLMQNLNMVQGAFYYVNTEKEDGHLEIISAYAYQRQKLVTKQFSLTDGLLGEAYLNKKMVEVRDLAEGYLTLLAGVGEASPSYLLIIPCQTNKEVLALLELASFQPLEEYKVAFLTELANTIGSTLANIRTAELTMRYLKEAQEAAEELRQQDEELRQNMEELAASHEQSRQQEEEIRKLLKKSSMREEMMKENVQELKKYQTEIQIQRDAYEQRIKELEEQLKQQKGNMK